MYIDKQPITRHYFKAIALKNIQRHINIYMSTQTEIDNPSEKLVYLSQINIEKSQSVSIFFT